MSRISDELGLNEDDWFEKAEQYSAELQTILRSGSHTKSADLLLEWLSSGDARIKAVIISLYCYRLEQAICETLPKMVSDHIKEMGAVIRYLGEIIRERTGYE